MPRKYPSDFNTKKISPHYLLSAEEQFFKEEIVDTLLNFYKINKLFDFVVIDFKKNRENDLRSSLTQTPMSGKKRLVLIKDCETISDGSKVEDGQPDKLGSVMSVLVTNKTTSAIFLTDKRPKDLEKGFFKAFENVYDHIQCYPMLTEGVNSIYLDEWISNRMFQYGIHNHRDTQIVLTLKHCVGANLYRLQKEILKISLFCKLPTPQEILEICGSQKLFNDFELGEKVVVMAKGNTEDFCEIAIMTKRLLDDGQEPIKILYSLDRFIKRISMMFLVEKNTNELAEFLKKDMGEYLGKKYYIIYKKADINFNKLRRWTKLLADMDLEMKKGYINPTNILFSGLMKFNMIGE